MQETNVLIFAYWVLIINEEKDGRSIREATIRSWQHCIGSPCVYLHDIMIASRRTPRPTCSACAAYATTPNST